MNSKLISDGCIYTIAHTDKLNSVYKEGGTGTFTEKKNWATASRLLKTCQQNDMQLLILFAPAEETWQSIYYATLDEIKIDKTDSEAITTTFQVSNLTPFGKKKPLKTSVIVKSTGRPIPEGHIRPYVICVTPERFLRRNK